MRGSFSDTSPCFATAPVIDDVNGARTIYPQTSPVPTPTVVCGDADGSGRLTVTDGVQVLRAAAGLSSICTPAVCDVDGSGEITVGDAVDVLRGAAGLARRRAVGCGPD